VREYSEEEQTIYANMIAAQRGDSFGGLIYLMSLTLRSLCKVPLLLRLALDYWYEKREFSTNLNLLFRSWINQLLQIPGTTPSQLMARESALGLNRLKP
jgi:hypothetical protein